MGKSSKTPKAPDPYVTAQAQAQANKEAILESARVNQINEVTPYGTLRYTGTIGQPNRTRTTALSPSGQRQLDSQNAIAEALSNTAFERTGQINQLPFSLEGVPQLYSNYLNVNTPSAPAAYADPSAITGGLSALGGTQTAGKTYQDFYNELKPQYTTERQVQVGGKSNLPPVGSPIWHELTQHDDVGLSWEDLYNREVGLETTPARTVTRTNVDEAGLEAAANAALQNYTSQNAVPREYQYQPVSQPATQTGGQPAYQGSDRVGNLEKALFDRSMMLLRPGFDRQRDRTEQQLADRGLPIGQEAYSDVIDQLDRSQNEAQLAAALEAIAGASAEDSRLFGQSLTARQQGINERLLERTQPINELALMLGGSPSLVTPQFGANAQYQISPADVQGAIQSNYAGRVNAANQQNAQNQAALGGLFGLGGTILSAGSGSILGGLLGL